MLENILACQDICPRISPRFFSVNFHSTSSWNSSKSSIESFSRCTLEDNITNFAKDFLNRFPKKSSRVLRELLQEFLKAFICSFYLHEFLHQFFHGLLQRFFKNHRSISQGFLQGFLSQIFHFRSGMYSG